MTESLPHTNSARITYERAVAVVGCGNWGRNLVRNFYELGVLCYVCDVDSSRLSQMRDKYPDLRAHTDFESLLANDEVRSIVIATPAELHFAMASAALRAGKDVFVEKPFVLAYEDGKELVRLADDGGRILMVGHLLEYHPAIIKLNEIILRGELGSLKYIYANRLNFGRVRQKENILWSFAPHDIAVILRMVGKLPSEVTCTGAAYIRNTVADVTVTNLIFDNGVRAHIFVSWLHPYREHRLVVVGSKRIAVFNDVREQATLVLYNHGVDSLQTDETGREAVADPIEFWPEEPLRRECEHFLECLSTRCEPLTSGKNALQVLKVLHASQQSLEWLGQSTAVEMPSH